MKVKPLPINKFRNFSEMKQDMIDDNLKQFDVSDSIQKMVLNIMYVMRENYSKYPEYKTIMMNLTSVSKEINSIRIKEITGEVEGRDEE